MRLQLKHGDRLNQRDVSLSSEVEIDGRNTFLYNHNMINFVPKLIQTYAKLKLKKKKLASVKK